MWTPRCVAVLLVFALQCVSAASVSSRQAVHIANTYLQRYHVDVRSLNVSVKLRHEPDDHATDPAVRKKLVHRTHWWVYFVPRDPDTYGGAHSVYIAPSTGEIIGWCSER